MVKQYEEGNIELYFNDFANEKEVKQSFANLKPVSQLNKYNPSSQPYPDSSTCPLLTQSSSKRTATPSLKPTETER